MTSTPTRDAISLVEATIACLARTGSRDAARGAIAIEETNRATRRIEQAGFLMFSAFLKKDFQAVSIN